MATGRGEISDGQGWVELCKVGQRGGSELGRRGRKMWQQEVEKKMED